MFYTFKELKEKYQWNTNEDGIQAQIRYAKNRGVTIEKAYKKGATYFQIIEDITQDEWKIFPLDNYYEVSKSGKVRTTDTKKIVGAKTTQGYIMVTNQTVTPTKYYKVHRMVMETYNPIENSQNYVVDHIDGNKENNNISNLRWVTQRQNMIYRDENWAEISQNLQKLIEKQGYDWVNRLILLELEKKQQRNKK